jgi:F420-dependent oxidoreductase-like protein
VTLGALARETERIRLGTLVTSGTFRLPGLLAVTVAQVDNMSGGRVELGLGTGWYDDEHAHHGIPFPPLKERFERLEEQLQIVHGMWSTRVGDRYSFEGEHYRLVDSPALPKPTQPGGPPVIIGGLGLERTPRLAARYAAEFNSSFAPIEYYRQQVEAVRKACEAIDRDPDDIILSSAQVVCCGTDDAEVARRAANIGHGVDELKKNGLAGSPAEIVDRIADWAETGASRLYLQVLDFDDLDHVRLLGEEVLAVLP